MIPQIMRMSLETLNVLFLEDLDSDIDIIRRRLTGDLGCNIAFDSAKSEKAFLNYIKNKKYDVILADYALPGYSAEAALKACRHICPETPFICVSGTIGEDIAVELLKNGATDYVLKDRLGRLAPSVSRAVTSTLPRDVREHAIASSEEGNKMMLDATGDSIVMFDADGTIINANSAFIKGCRKKDPITGKNLKELFPQDKYSDFCEKRLWRIKQVFSSGIMIEFEDSRNGRWFSNRFYPNYADGNVTAVTMFSTDVTHVKKIAEEESRTQELRREAEILKAKEKEYLEIIDSSTIGTWIYNFESGELKYSSQWLEHIGGTDNETAKQLMIINIVYLTNEACAIGQSKFKTEYSLKTADKPMWVLDQGKILFDNNGHPWKIYGTSMDITERKAYEQDLKVMAGELEQKNKLITNFFINLSHEFKTPISIILLVVEILEMYQKQDVLDHEKIARQVSVMKQNAYRLGRLVGNLLDITKIDAGFMTPNWSSVDIVFLLQSLVSSMRHLTQSKGLKLNFIATSRSMVMPSDPQLIERILLNLISNSIKHTEAGGYIIIKCLTTAEKITISVRDSGEGIPEEKKDIIFDRFRQVNTSLTRSSEGCGIGLALCKSLVEMLKGRIWFKSRPGEGACFYVELPVIDADTSGLKADTNGMDVSTRIQMEFSDIDF